MQNRASFDDHACFHISNWRWSIGSGRSECQQRRWRIATDVTCTSARRPCENFAIILSGGIYSWNRGDSMNANIEQLNEIYCHYSLKKLSKKILDVSEIIENLVLSSSSFFFKFIQEMAIILVIWLIWSHVMTGNRLFISDPSILLLRMIKSRSKGDRKLVFSRSVKPLLYS